MKRTTQQNAVTMVLVSMGTLVPRVLYADSSKDVNGLYDFASGTKIRSEEVNGNFDVLGNFMTSYEDAITVDGSGKVGVGVTTPSQALDVNGTVKATSFVGDGAGLTGIPGLSQWSNVSGGISYGGGNVGIGTTGPKNLLHLSSTAPAWYVERTDRSANEKIWRFANNGEDFEIQTRTDTDAVGQSAMVIDRTGTAVTDVSFPNGNVGIGTTAPDYRLHVQSSSSADGKAFGMQLSNGNWIAQFGGDANGAPQTYVGGNVGIGTLNPSQKLHVVGKVTADDYLYNSDARLKTDILPLENASEGIACLEGVTYRWSDPLAPQSFQIGLIAQDVERCFPELVSTGPNGYKSVSYARLVAPLIENAKEQQQALAAQQQAFASQQREIVRLKAEQTATNARLARLEALLSSRR